MLRQVIDSCLRYSWWAD